MKMKFVGMTGVNKLKYTLSPKSTIQSLAQVKVMEEGKEIAVTAVSTLGMSAASGYIELAQPLDLSKNYTVSIDGYGKKTVMPTPIFDSRYFADNYHYDGTDLGAVITGNTTTFRVWAPTASGVVLNLFTAGDGVDACKRVDMVKGEKGVWAHREECGHGSYYAYTVTTAVGTQEAVDPYARAAGVNGNRGMVVDLSLTDPEGWENDRLENSISHYSEAIIWEVHVRDFSNKIADSRYKGKFLAFTETGLTNEYGKSVGIDYLKELGVTHVQLLPVYDYATVDEANSAEEFNWGYDPNNYNVPEGSYSTDPFRGEVRIREYKQMVQALHTAGIGVVMDMVYNHTYDRNGSLNRIVPYYYYRYTPTGAYSSASGCGNDTASERYMFSKFMVESAAYWVKEYKLDGLRFDLMGLHDVKTMQEVERAVHAVNPNAILYGEGWTMGATMDGSKQANQGNISLIKPTGKGIGAVAVFNDGIRDGLKGSVFNKTSRGYIGGAAATNVAQVLFGIKGGKGGGAGWSVTDDMVINYMSAHDNHSLWDKLALSNPEDSPEVRAEMNRLGAAVLIISRGTPFFQAGEEMLRSKDGDENSYKSSDGVNNIRWDTLSPDSEAYRTMEYYRGLIAMRQAYGIFRGGEEVTFQDLGEGRMEIRFGESALAIVNPTDISFTHTLSGSWNLVADETAAGSDSIRVEAGEIQLAPRSIRIYVK